MKVNRCEAWQYSNKLFIIFQMLLNIGINSAGNGLGNVATGTTIKTSQTFKFQ
jgi:hypothetical protein